MLQAEDNLCFSVIFYDPPQVLWWQRWLRPGFGHVALIIRRPAVWSILEWRTQGIVWTAISGEEIELYSQWLIQHGATIVDFNPKGRETITPMKFTIMTCVQLVAHAVGVGRTVLTPWQLYKELVVRGGKVIRRP